MHALSFLTRLQQRDEQKACRQHDVYSMLLWLKGEGHLLCSLSFRTHQQQTLSLSQPKFFGRGRAGWLVCKICVHCLTEK